MSVYRKKPVEIEAIQWDGFNAAELIAFAGDNIEVDQKNGQVRVVTHEGIMIASPEDYIIKEPNPTDDRKFYPCKEDIFHKTYEKVR